ncbi:carboxylesterase family protein [Sphingobium sp. BYY-5]|uniref:carboxylesterase/lipase family protein n=1 Tax=Sphingobium sp. BYY-5 TaxID=2926400 RepID=UPI001FA80ECA|nr:carboxylesterase family protein [Sphingobium sp. BYY-5]MCI4591958.1 carboxylesterase family protein [Sphingobium sp. BYY-5]
MMRRLGLTLGLLALTSVAPAQVVDRPAGDPVSTEAGLVAGKTLPSGVRAWLGVPFAAPPVRDLRWRDPQPHAAWNGVWNADRAAAECIQPLRGRNINHYFGEEATSEDCLYLNIWAPPEPPPPGKAYPVIAWIYGGGFNVGSASMANYSGEPLASKGAVYVSIAYRVGSLGFLAHPALTAEGNGGSGNYGLKDQIAALQWIQHNIAGFGGDPGNVTIAGQSAGSMSVSLLQASPVAKGLFHRVVGMSGGVFGGQMAPAPLAEAEVEGVALQKALGASSIEAMRDMPADRLIALAAPVKRRPIVLDGRVVPVPPEAAFAAGQQSDVPVMIGFTRDESFRSLGPIAGVAEYERAVRLTFPAHAAQILQAYPARMAEEARRAARDIERDATLGLQMAEWAKGQSMKGKAPAYAYFFTRTHPYRPGVTFADHDPATVGAYHTADVPYWLGTLDSLNLFRVTRDWTQGDRQLSAEMMDRLLAFARDGDPGRDWPAWKVSQPRVHLLGEAGGMVDWPHFKTLPLFKDAAPPVPAERPRIRD